MPTVDANGVRLEYEALGDGRVTVVTAQQEFGADSLARLLPGPPTNYRVYAIHLRKLSKSEQGPGEDVRPRIELTRPGSAPTRNACSGQPAIHA